MNAINPSHYTSGHIECIEALEASMSIEAFKGFLKGNIMKYVWRYEKKKGVEDLRKAQWYLDRLIAICDQEEAIAEVEADGCSDGFCPMPAIRQGPPEMFEPIN